MIYYTLYQVRQIPILLQNIIKTGLMISPSQKKKKIKKIGIVTWEVK